MVTLLRKHPVQAVFYKKNRNAFWRYGKDIVQDLCSFVVIVEGGTNVSVLQLILVFKAQR